MSVADLDFNRMEPLRLDSEGSRAKLANEPLLNEKSPEETIMSGNPMSSTEFLQMLHEGGLHISPFDDTRLRLAHYKLSPNSVWSSSNQPDGEAYFQKVHQFDSGPNRSFTFPQGAYYLIEVSEDIVVPDGMYAEFTIISEFALRGFDLIAGKLDAGYGRLAGGKQKLLFGVKNLLDRENVFDSEHGLAHMSLVEVEGQQEPRRAFSTAEVARLKNRNPRRWERAQDDGVFYPD